MEPRSVLAPTRETLITCPSMEVCWHEIDIDNSPGAVAPGLGTSLAAQQKLGIPAEWRPGPDPRHCFDSRADENRLTGHRWLQEHELLIAAGGCDQQARLGECRNCLK